jgi:hypothetical protein
MLVFKYGLILTTVGRSNEIKWEYCNTFLLPKGFNKQITALGEFAPGDFAPFSTIFPRIDQAILF